MHYFRFQLYMRLSHIAVPFGSTAIVSGKWKRTSELKRGSAGPLVQVPDSAVLAYALNGPKPKASPIKAIKLAKSHDVRRYAPETGVAYPLCSRAYRTRMQPYLLEE